MFVLSGGEEGELLDALDAEGEAGVFDFLDARLHDPDLLSQVVLLVGRELLEAFNVVPPTNNTIGRVSACTHRPPTTARGGEEGRGVPS